MASSRVSNVVWQFAILYRSGSLLAKDEVKSCYHQIQ